MVLATQSCVGLFTANILLLVRLFERCRTGRETIRFNNTLHIDAFGTVTRISTSFLGLLTAEARTCMDQACF
jgi:hypothetical protein